MNNPKDILLVALIILLPLSLPAQRLYYDVVKGNKSVGNLIVTKKKLPTGAVKYNIKSDVSLKILFTFNVEFVAEEIFENGRLVDGDAVSTLNGRTQKDSHISKKGQGVIIKLNGSDYDHSEQEVTYSVPMLYFEEPGHREAIFSQQFARYLTVKHMDGEYILDSPDGYNYYSYKNGICQEVKVNRDFATFYFKLKEVK